MADTQVVLYRNALLGALSMGDEHYEQRRLLLNTAKSFDFMLEETIYIDEQYQECVLDSLVCAYLIEGLSGFEEFLEKANVQIVKNQDEGSIIRVH